MILSDYLFCGTCIKFEDNFILGFAFSSKLRVHSKVLLKYEALGIKKNEPQNKQDKEPNIPPLGCYTNIQNLQISNILLLSTGTFSHK